MARKPRGKPPSRFNLRLIGVVVAAVAITTPLAVLGGRAVFVTKGDLETIIRDAGFSPLGLPSKLVMPGSIYQVSKDGRLYSTICRASETDIASVVKEFEDPGRARKLAGEVHIRPRCQGGGSGE